MSPQPTIQDDDPMGFTPEEEAFFAEGERLETEHSTAVPAAGGVTWWQRIWLGR